MSGTRHAKPGSPLRQERYASSAEFERGLLATAAARRCSVLDSAADRELIWQLHFMSRQEGGLKAVVAGLIEEFGNSLGTETMVQLGKRAGQTFNSAEVSKVRGELPSSNISLFPLRGESLRVLEVGWCYNSVNWEELQIGLEDAERRAESDPPEHHPSNYPVESFLDLCRRAALAKPAADNSSSHLEEVLHRLCLDPAFDLKEDAPWYFAGLVPALREYTAQWIAQCAAGVVVTSLGRKVQDTLDYTLASRSMTLVEGDPRIGKSFAARSWCEQHPGQARFVEVPTGNDDTGFFRALARGLGVGSFQQYKANEIRERVESVLLTGDLLLCLDEAHRLWPEVNLWRGFPKRINWVMSIANHGVPICLIGTPQFIERQKASEQNSGWNSAQFMGRLGHYEPLPCELSPEDLMAVARAILPEADKTTLRALAAYARTSARYLAAIDAIAKRARYIAGRAGRNEAATDEVRSAMQESVIPADSKLVRALKSVEKSAGRRARGLAAESPVLPMVPAQDESVSGARPRDASLAGPRNRLNGEALELAGKE